MTASPKKNNANPWANTYDSIGHLIDSPTPNLEGLRQEIEKIKNAHGLQAAYNTLMQAEVAAGARKPTLAIFDHTGHIIGGGQKYGFTVAYALKDMFDVTLLLNRETSLKDLENWYDMDLSECKIKIIQIPFFDQFEDRVHLDPARVSYRTGNPFHAVSKESGNYDFFINNSMNEKVLPLSNRSYMICHFPERRPRDYFYADRYTVIYNSRYTAGWIEKKWNFAPHKHIFPPVDMAPAVDEPQAERENAEKEKMILSVARFETGGSKKQWEMVQTFLTLNRRFADLINGWKLVLAGGSAGDNPYLERIKHAVKANPDANIVLKINVKGSELKELYKKSSIFWHLCGLDQTDPALVEHFGMTIAESMQNQMVPIVFDGGGQKEIVEQGITGYRVTSTAQLMRYTKRLVRDPNERRALAEKALEKSKEFERKTFERKVKEYFREELDSYLNTGTKDNS